MALFGKRPSQPPSIPESYVRGLRDFGEHLSGENPGFNGDLIADLRMMDLARDQPVMYVERLAAEIFSGLPHISDYAGPCCLGAVEVATEDFRHAVAETPAWERILDTAIAYLRELRTPYARLRPFMRTRWERAHTSDEW